MSSGRRGAAEPARELERGTPKADQELQLEAPSQAKEPANHLRDEQGGFHGRE